MTLISKPGRRIYISYKDLNSFNFGFQLFLLRTSQGIITSQTALKNKIGGELLLKISFVAA
jgi:small subunit ribosomal protein S8